MLRRILTTTILSAAIAFGFLFTMSNQAHAATTYPPQTASTTGAAATCSLTTWATHIQHDTAQISCQLSDTLGDSHSVYLEWWQDGFGHIRFNNSDGHGKTIPVTDARINYDGSFGTAYFKVCRDIQLGRDNCSVTYSWSLH